MVSLSTCPAQEKIQQMVSGEPAQEEIEAFADHLERCPTCAANLEFLQSYQAMAARIRQSVRMVAQYTQSEAALNPDPNATTDDYHSSSSAADSLSHYLSPPQQPGELGRLGSFRLLSQLGAGGMGMVFEAEDTQLKRRVALKIMHPPLAARLAYRERFLREAQAVAALDHEHIVPIYQVGEERGMPFFAMPLLKGQSLLRALTQHGPILPLTDILHLGRQIALGLATAHQSGLVHRDIKPGNLWLDSSGAPAAPAFAGRIKILDFGLARPIADNLQLTQAGIILGTTGYMSPEQARGDHADARCDLFSLGVVLYQLGTGQMPFRGANMLAILSALATVTPPSPRTLNPAVPAALDALVMQLLAKEPDARPRSAQEVAERLQAIANESPPLPGGSPWWRRWPTVAAALGVALAVTVAVVLLFFPPWKSPEPEPPIDKRPAPLKGSFDIRVTEIGNPLRQELLLHQKLALPLKEGMIMQMKATVNRKAFLYVVYLDSLGVATPLYPWKNSDWKQRPAAEEPQLQWVADGPLGPSPSGIESLLLLVREERLPENVDLAALFAGLPKQSKLPHPQARAWFENGAVVEDEEGRGPVQIGQDNSVTRTQELLRGKLRTLFPYSRAVCFAFQGD